MITDESTTSPKNTAAFEAKVARVKRLSTIGSILGVILFALGFLAYHFVPILIDNTYRAIETTATLKERATIRKELIDRGFARYNETTGEYYLRTPDQVAGDISLIKQTTLATPNLTGTVGAVNVTSNETPRTQSGRKREAGTQ